MELTIRVAWGALALIHASPAAVLFAPGLIRSLYGVDGRGDLGVLLTHRGGLFLAVVAVCLLALVDPGARRAASLVTAVSVVSFLAVYALAGLPAGPLQVVAWADLLALAPLALVASAAWAGRPA